MRGIINILLVLLYATAGYSQTEYYWKSDASSGNWNQDWWRGWNEVPSGGEILRFDNNAWTSMTNDLAATNRHIIMFDATASSSRTIGGSTENTFYDWGGATPKIENNSSVLHTINFPLKLGYSGGMEINPVNGALTFGGNINNNSYNITVWGDNGNALTFSGVISGTGKLIIKQNSLVKISGTSTYSGNTEIDKGELWFNEGGATGGGTIYVGNGGQPAVTAKLWIADMDGGTTVNEPIVVNSSSGCQYRVIGGLNSGGTNTYSGILALNGTTSMEANNSSGAVVFNGVISGASDFVITGPGKVTLNAQNTASGNMYVVNGTLEVNNTTDPLDVATIYLGETSGSNSATFQIGTAAVTVDNGINVRSGSSGTIYVKYAPGSGTGTISGGITLNREGFFEAASGGTMNVTGVISGTNNIVKTGAGTLKYSGNNSYTGVTKISAGTLELGAADRISNSSNIEMNGGIFSTGPSSGYGETVGTLKLTENSTIALGTGVHTLTFSASNGESWTGGKTLTITGWTGTAGSSGTSGKIFVGSDVNGLTSVQLSQISFSGYSGIPVLLSNGELVPGNIYTTAANGNWSSTGTWICSCIPPGGAEIVINHDVTLNQ
ncbi:MAG: autotransporter-associated beta strand repeat-containing protein, partial [Bacteroidetes bacterium]|nr:autotransporter-associated beta strand repeat-containing protein [Bacteroidota bacterium]